MNQRKPIPRQKDDNYTEHSAAERRTFLSAETGANFDYTSYYSAKPSDFSGNIENFIGVVQMPVGVAGPCLIHGEHAEGWFYVPMATTEGTLVASYSRGMRLISESGGAKVTVIDDVMQRAPMFECHDARDTRDLSNWIDENFHEIAAAAEATTRIGKLQNIQRWPVARMLYTRFNFSTGDAAGQNMTSRATRAAMMWIAEHFPGGFMRVQLSGAIETDKKHSHMNLMHSRGKRVIAEVTIPREVLVRITRAEPADLFRVRLRSMTGAVLSGSAYNGPHSANGIAALFLATGQDVANVVESHAGLNFLDLHDNGDLYYSVTLPSVICATHGGGTSLPSQRECLAMVGCVGKGKARKLAEIIGATILAGDISLSSAIVADEFVDAHERLGRNR
ncbi:MAG: hydroxymethylglutaryl-CoA reductase [Pirellulaceae bacterium]|nr:hydroxymethylglutaryl-CoA reductase [Pirellulaceae bacterium]